MAESIRKSDFARDVGVSAARVSQWVGQGLPVEADGRLDRQKALAWVAQHVDRSAGGWPVRRATAAVPAGPVKPSTISMAPATTDKPPSTLIADAGRVLIVGKARKVQAEAKLLEHKEKRVAGELIPAAEVQERWTDVASEMQNAVLTLPERVCNRLPAEWRSELNLVLKSETEKLLKELSDAIRLHKNL